MRWTRERRRARAIAGRVEPRERTAGAHDERRLSVRQNHVVPTPVAGAKSAESELRPDRAEQAVANLPATVTRRIRRRGERGISRQTIAQGMPDASAEPVCSCAHFFRAHRHTRPRVQRASRHSLHPSWGSYGTLGFEGEPWHNSGIRCREIAKVCAAACWYVGSGNPADDACSRTVASVSGNGAEGRTPSCCQPRERHTLCLNLAIRPSRRNCKTKIACLGGHRPGRQIGRSLNHDHAP